VLVGIDIGGTKTHVRIEDAGQVVLDRSVPSMDWQHGGLLDDDDNASRLLGLFAEVEGARSAPLVVGAHGLDSSWQRLEFQDRLAAAHRGPVRTVNDVELLAPAAGFDEAIAVIAGTGSKVVAHGSDGDTITAGGYGFLLSDPGSAAALAREAVRAVLRARDEGRAVDALGRDLMNHFGVIDEIALSYEFTANARLTTWGALAPLIFTAADAGSELAARVIDDAAKELARDVGLVHARGAVGSDVVCAGGVVTNQPRLFNALTRHIDDLDKGFTVHLLSIAPVAGAIELAKKLHNHAPITMIQGGTHD
jgi:glucosamine kinase